MGVRLDTVHRRDQNTQWKYGLIKERNLKGIFIWERVVNLMKHRVECYERTCECLMGLMELDGVSQA